MSSNDRQVGGDHYKSDYEHWDFVEYVGLGYLEGCATKYVSRWRKKGGVDDLRKAEHYVDKLIEIGRRNRTHVDELRDSEIVEFCDANKLWPSEANVVRLLTTWSSIKDLETAKACIQILIASHADGTPKTDSNKHARPELDQLLRRAKELVESMSRKELEAMMSEQSKS